MDPQAYLLPLCVGLTLLGVFATILTWQFSKRRGKVVQVIGLTLLPVGLYLSGLLLIVWNFVAAVVGWVTSVAFTPMIWAGVGFLGLAVLLWVIGGILVARRTNRALKATSPAAAGRPAKEATPKSVGGPGQQAAPKGAATGDPEMDEIEELLRRRGIE